MFLLQPRITKTKDTPLHILDRNGPDSGRLGFINTCSLCVRRITSRLVLSVLKEWWWASVVPPLNQMPSLRLVTPLETPACKRSACCFVAPKRRPLSTHHIKHEMYYTDNDHVSHVYALPGEDISTNDNGGVICDFERSVLRAGISIQ